MTSMLWDSILTSRVERKFREWFRGPDGERCILEATRRALQLQARGFVHYSVAGIWESMRFDRSLEVGPDEAGFKLNNNHRAYIARELMKRTPRLEGFFELRELRGRS